MVVEIGIALDVLVGVFILEFSFFGLPNGSFPMKSSSPKSCPRPLWASSPSVSLGMPTN
jgi:hypothetical protein